MDILSGSSTSQVSTLNRDGIMSCVVRNIPGWWRRGIVFFIVLTRVLDVFGASTRLLLHLSEPALHPLHIIIKLWRAIHIMILRINTIPVRQGAVV